MTSLAVQSLNRVGRLHCASDLPSSTTARASLSSRKSCACCIVMPRSFRLCSAHRTEGEAAQKVPLEEP